MSIGNYKVLFIFALPIFADMVKLVDMPDLGSGAARRVGSSPIIRTESPNESLDFFCGQKEREVYAERSRSKYYYPHRKSK